MKRKKEFNLTGTMSTPARLRRANDRALVAATKAGTLSMSTGSSAAITKLPDGVRGFKVNALVGKGEVERRGRQEAPRGVFKLSPPQLK